jgi:hypothetical protein
MVALSAVHTACQFSEQLCTDSTEFVDHHCEGRTLVSVAFRCDPENGNFDQPTGWSDRHDCGEGSACVSSACLKTCRVNGDCDRSLQCNYGPDGTKYCQQVVYGSPCSLTASDTNDELRCGTDLACLSAPPTSSPDHGWSPYEDAAVSDGDASLPDAQATRTYQCLR